MYDKAPMRRDGDARRTEILVWEQKAART